MDDFETPDASYAQDAALLICNLLHFLIDGESASIQAIVASSIDLINAKVVVSRKVVVISKAVEEDLFTDPLMQAELQFQQDTLRAVATTSPEVVRLRL